MKLLLTILCLFYLTATAGAETYRWEDDQGIHFSDNLGSVPTQYRQQAAENAGEDITVRDPEVARSVAESVRHRQAREAQEARAAAAEAAIARQKAVSMQKLYRQLAEQEKERQEQERRNLADIERRQILNKLNNLEHNQPLGSSGLDNKLDRIDRKLSDIERRSKYGW